MPFHMLYMYYGKAWGSDLVERDGVGLCLYKRPWKGCVIWFWLGQKLTTTEQVWYGKNRQLHTHFLINIASTLSELDHEVDCIPIASINTFKQVDEQTLCIKEVRSGGPHNISRIYRDQPNFSWLRQERFIYRWLEFWQLRNPLRPFCSQLDRF